MKLTRLVLRTGLILGAAAVIAVDPAPAQSDCAGAVTLFDTGLVTDAVDSFAEADEAGLGCGSGPAAQEALAAKNEAQALVLEGEAAEARGDRETALERYSAALAINSQAANAEDAVRRLSGVATDTTTTTDLFAGADALESIGRDPEATDAALDTIAETGELPSKGSEVRDLVDQHWWQQLLTCVGNHWAWIAAGLVVLAMLGAWGFRTWPGRKVTRRGLLKRFGPRLAIEVENATGKGTDLSQPFRLQLRESVRRDHSRLGGHARFVTPSDAPTSMPDVTELGGHAKLVATLWGWFVKQNRITAQIALMPATTEGVGCYIILTEANGSTVRGTRHFDGRLTKQPPGWPKPAPAPKDVDAHDWLSLIPMARAWLLFATRQLQSTSIGLEWSLGTSNHAAYGYFLSGSDNLGDTESAYRDFKHAIELDPEFLEAHVNVGYTAANLHKYVAAEESLQIVRRAKAKFSLPSSRLAALKLRATYNLAVVAVNQLTPQLDREYEHAADFLDAANKLVKLTTELHDDVESRSTGTSATDQLARSVRDRVRILHAGALDLQHKYDAFVANPSQGIPGIPLPYRADDTPTDRWIQALATIAEYDQPATADAQYSISCIWARDARLRSANPEAAWDKAAEQLTKAITTDEYARRAWTTDPAFAEMPADLKLRVQDAANTAAQDTTTP